MIIMLESEKWKKIKLLLEAKKSKTNVGVGKKIMISEKNNDETKKCSKIKLVKKTILMLESEKWKKIEINVGSGTMKKNKSNIGCRKMEKNNNNVGVGKIEKNKTNVGSGKMKKK